MVLQHTLVGKSLHWHGITIILFNAKVGIFSVSYVCNTIIHLLFHYFLSLESLLHFKYTNLFGFFVLA